MFSLVLGDDECIDHDGFRQCHVVDKSQAEGFVVLTLLRKLRVCCILLSDCVCIEHWEKKQLGFRLKSQAQIHLSAV